MVYLKKNQKKFGGLKNSITFEPSNKYKMKKINYRKQYQIELEDYFNNNNIVYDKDVLKSIMSKVSINSRNKYGKVDFQEELCESGIENGKIFYIEYGKKDTYNRMVKKL